MSFRLGVGSRVLGRLETVDTHRLLLAVCAATDSIKTVTYASPGLSGYVLAE